MRSLIIGASGQIGGQLASRCRAEKLPWLGTAFRNVRFGLHWLDPRERAAVVDLVNGFRPDVVFLPAAMTPVVGAETSPDECRALNETGPAIVARAAGAALERCRAGDRGRFRVVGPAHLWRLEFARLIAETVDLNAGPIISKTTAELAQAA